MARGLIFRIYEVDGNLGSEMNGVDQPQGPVQFYIMPYAPSYLLDRQGKQWLPIDKGNNGSQPKSIFRSSSQCLMWPILKRSLPFCSEIILPVI